MTARLAPALMALAFLCVAPCGTSGQQGAPALPPFPPDVPPDALIHYSLMDGTPQAQQAVWRDTAGVRHIVFMQNLPSCQVRIRSAIVTDTAGLPVSIRTEGTTCDPPRSADEEFVRADGLVRWQNRVERGDTVTSDPRYYFSLADLPEESALLARALLAAGGTLPLWPAGEASIEHIQDLTMGAGDSALVIRQYRMTGLGLFGRPVWLDDRDELFALGGYIRKGRESALATVRAAQRRAVGDREVELERTLVRPAQGRLVLYDANVFDANTGSVRSGLTVVISGNRIESVEPTRTDDRSKPGAIDAAGHTLLPGLWDNHSHDPGLTHIAAGVTTVRVPVANAAVQRDDFGPLIAGGPLEPRGVPIAMITGQQTDRRRGQRPQTPADSPLIAHSAEEVRGMVARHAAAGFRQVKMYDELPPAWVPVMIEEAHRHGLRASGHIPNGVTLTEAVTAGLDEVHHARFLFPELAGDPRRSEDRVALRLRVADAELLRSPRASALVALLRDHRVTLDATLFASEDSWTWRPGRVPASSAPIFERLPVVQRRQLLDTPPFLAAETWTAAQAAEIYDAGRHSLATLLGLIGMLSDAGVTVLPGTDHGFGFALHRELELHVAAGIPPGRVLQSATLLSARVMELDHEVGSIDPGKLADLVLVEGDPTRDISDIRRTRLVIKDGALIDVRGLYREIGIAWR